MKLLSTDYIEYCIYCEEDTTYLKSDHIDERNYYIEGAGQLCEKCYYEVYRIDSILAHLQHQNVEC